MRGLKVDVRPLDAAGVWCTHVGERGDLYSLSTQSSNIRIRGGELPKPHEHYSWGYPEELRFSAGVV